MAQPGSVEVRQKEIAAAGAESTPQVHRVTGFPQRLHLTCGFQVLPTVRGVFFEVGLALMEAGNKTKRRAGHDWPPPFAVPKDLGKV